MAWNWQISGWPDFRYDAAALAPLEQRFLLSSGEIVSAVHHVSPAERDQLRIDLLSDEAMKTSAIEGEMLDRQSVQSSLRRQLGLSPDSYLNNIIEQYHRFIKRTTRQVKGFKSFASAQAALAGIEAAHMIRKGAAQRA